MTKVKLGGRELTIPDDRVAEYLEQGYSVIDARGNTLQVGKILTYEQALTENNKLAAQNKRLKAAHDSLVIENQRLNDDIEKLKSEIEKATENSVQAAETSKPAKAAKPQK